MMELLTELTRAGKTVVVVTHERDLARRFGRVVELADGRIINQAGAQGRASGELHS